MNVLPLLRLTLCVFLLTFIVSVRAQNRPAIPATPPTVSEEIVEVRISDMNAAVREDRITIAALALRINDLEQQQAMIRGSILGFGGLLAVLQAVGLMKKKAA